MTYADGWVPCFSHLGAYRGRLQFHVLRAAPLEYNLVVRSVDQRLSRELRLEKMLTDHDYNNIDVHGLGRLCFQESIFGGRI